MTDHSRCIADARKRLEEAEAASAAPFDQHPACRVPMFSGQECGLRYPHSHVVSPVSPVYAEFPSSDPTMGGA